MYFTLIGKRDSFSNTNGSNHSGASCYWVIAIKRMLNTPKVTMDKTLIFTFISEILSATECAKTGFYGVNVSDNNLKMDTEYPHSKPDHY
jgi:hypothetical protein